MARRNDKGRGGSAPLPLLRWRVAPYIRLSKEDVNRGRDESNSVLNQRSLLEDYCQQHRDEFESVEPAYIDDGYTGTDTNREAFQRLLSDVYAKKINCVLVKDLSRLSRNYADAGSLIENLFVEMNVRFISLAEGIDSYLNPDSVSNLLVPITNVINDNFCYQTSKKIRQVFDMKRRNGAFIGGFATYGYAKNPDDKNALIIDEEAAEIVRNIYAWCLEGMSRNAIVRRLNDRGILCPTEYKKSKGLSYQNPNGSTRPLWSAKTVGDILRNRLYIGDMVQGRQRVKSYKIHTLEQVPESEWYIVENTHEGIIERSVFAKVQELLQRDTRTAPRKTTLYLFSGLLRCADCGRGMSRSKVRNNVYYFCRTYKDQSKTACTRHSMKHVDLEAAVLCAVQMQVYLAVNSSEVVREVDAAPAQKSQWERLTALLAAKEQEREKIMRFRQSIYQDWKEGEITREDFRHMKEDYDRQIESMDAILRNLRDERTTTGQESHPDSPDFAAFKKIGMIEGLSRELLLELVDHIKIHENGCITIRLRCRDPFDDKMEGRYKASPL